MCWRYLGPEFDIHGGGLDLTFPHHENEIAQSQAAGLPFARYWVHHALLNLGEAKMSKSLGNVIDLDVVEALGMRPVELRYYLVRAALPLADRLLGRGAAARRPRRTAGSKGSCSGRPSGSAPATPGELPAAFVRRDGRRSEHLARRSPSCTSGAGGQRGARRRRRRRRVGGAGRRPGDARRTRPGSAVDARWGDQRGGDLRGVVDSLVALALEQRAQPARARTGPPPTRCVTSSSTAGIVVEDTPTGRDGRLRRAD